MQIEQEIRDIELRKARKSRVPVQSSISLNRSNSSLKLTPKRAFSVPLREVCKKQSTLGFSVLGNNLGSPNKNSISVSPRLSPISKLKTFMIRKNEMDG